MEWVSSQVGPTANDAADVSGGGGHHEAAHFGLIWLLRRHGVIYLRFWLRSDQLRTLLLMYQALVATKKLHV